jgi:hypothetical protein
MDFKILPKLFNDFNKPTSTKSPYKAAPVGMAIGDKMPDGSIYLGEPPDPGGPVYVIPPRPPDSKR